MTDLDLNALRALFPTLRDGDAHYFNNAFTSLVPTPVIEAMTSAALDRWRQPVARYEAARETVARFLNAPSDEVSFTPGTTEGLAWLGRKLALAPGDRVVSTLADHVANRAPWAGADLAFAGVDEAGLVDWDALEALMPGAKVVAIAAVSNVTGEIAPVARLARAARTHGAMLVVDAAQAAPHLPMDVAAWDADFVVFSGHKAWGPTGIGVFWGRRAAREAIGAFPAREEGLPPYEAAIGLAAALELLQASRTPAIEAHRRALKADMQAACGAMPGVRLLGPSDPERRIPLFSLALERGGAEAVSEALRAAGYWTRAGQHNCEPLHEALGLDATLRFSAQAYTTREEAHGAIAALAHAINP